MAQRALLESGPSVDAATRALTALVGVMGGEVYSFGYATSRASVPEMTVVLHTTFYSPDAVLEIGHGWYLASRKVTSSPWMKGSAKEELVYGYKGDGVVDG